MGLTLLGIKIDTSNTELKRSQIIRVNKVTNNKIYIVGFTVSLNTSICLDAFNHFQCCLLHRTDNNQLDILLCLHVL